MSLVGLRLATACCAFLSAHAAFADLWVKAYPEYLESASVRDISEASMLEPTADGGFILVGTADRRPRREAWAMKLDSQGRVEWRRSVIGAELDVYAGPVHTTTASEYLVAGTAEPGPPYDYYPGRDRYGWLVKLDARGDVMWQKAFQHASVRWIRSIQGDAIIASGSSIFPYRGAWVAKLNGGGEIIWQKNYEVLGTRAAWAEIVATSVDGGYFVAGRILMAADLRIRAWTMKLDGAGNVVWQRQYGLVDFSEARSVQSSRDGGFVVAGGAEGLAWIVKHDANGEILWQRTYGAGSFYSIQQAAGGGYIVAGNAWQPDGRHAAWVLRLDDSGEITWQTVYRGDESSTAGEVRELVDGGYAVSGTATRIYPIPSRAYPFVLKLAADGTIPACSFLESLAGTALESDLPVSTAEATVTIGFAVALPGELALRDMSVQVSRQCYVPSQETRGVAIEYYHRGMDHYFVTTSTQEIAALDASHSSGWVRTGESFIAYGPDFGEAGVCRFWSGQTFAPLSTHYFAASEPECKLIKQNPKWSYEGEVFAVAKPMFGFACSAQTMPIYRLYNDGKGGAPNHRHTTSFATRADMIAQGWVPAGVGMGLLGCAPGK